MPAVKWLNTVEEVLALKLPLDTWGYWTEQSFEFNDMDYRTLGHISHELAQELIDLGYIRLGQWRVYDWIPDPVVRTTIALERRSRCLM